VPVAAPADAGHAGAGPTARDHCAGDDDADDRGTGDDVDDGTEAHDDGRAEHDHDDERDHGDEHDRGDHRGLDDHRRPDDRRPDDDASDAAPVAPTVRPVGSAAVEPVESVESFRERAAAWIAAHAPSAPRDYGAICPPDLVEAGRAWQRLLDADGYAGIHWPTEWGGQGLTPAHQGAWLTECARAGVPPVFNMVGLVLAGGAILRFGTEVQKQRHLRATLAAEQLWCQLFSEPGSGSDLGSLSTRAVLDGDRFVVNGQKVWCSGGRYSDWGILMARTDPDAPKHAGISFLLLDMHLPGIEVRPLKQMTGEAEFDEVFFTDVEVPADCLLGPLHDGWNVGMAVLTNERGHIGASVIGLQRRLAAIARLGEGHELDAVTRQRLAELVGRGTTYTYLAQRQGPVASTAASLTKLGITELMFDAAALRADVAGTDALVAGTDALGLLAAPGGRIAGGTSQVQRNIIGERLLGLPREPRERGQNAARPQGAVPGVE
jgi:alkylation response protein AidB-like acyl-CoA dehydrogenase